MKTKKEKINTMLETAHVALTNVSYIIHKTNKLDA
jgi:agmatine deiminase